MHNNELSRQIIGRAIHVHQRLGPGLLEAVYQECLGYELQQAGFFVEKEKALPVIYKQVRLECGYRLDLLVERTVVGEIKAVEALRDIHLAQVLTYLKLGQYPLGLLINFNVKLLKDGIKRVIN